MTSSINASTSSGGGLIQSADASGILALQTAGVTAVTIDASQNLGLGVTPSAWGSSYKAMQIASYVAFAQRPAGSGDLILSWNAYNTSGNTSGSGYVYKITGDTASSYEQNGAHRWYVAPSGTAGNAITFTQAMTLDASGNLLVGTTSTSIAGSGSYLSSNGRWTTSTGSGGIFALFLNGSGTEIGRISNNSNTSTTYSTSSDYRLKENIAPMTGALSKVSELKPVTYNWKINGSEGQGFIAHELQAVVPDCVYGEKDAVDAEGNPVYQGIDTSFLVATLTAAIQELNAINDTQAQAITTLTERITALEGAQA